MSSRLGVPTILLARRLHQEARDVCLVIDLANQHSYAHLQKVRRRQCKKHFCIPPLCVRPPDGLPERSVVVVLSRLRRYPLQSWSRRGVPLNVPPLCASPQTRLSLNATFASVGKRFTTYTLIIEPSARDVDRRQASFWSPTESYMLHQSHLVGGRTVVGGTGDHSWIGKDVEICKWQSHFTVVGMTPILWVLHVYYEYCTHWNGSSFQDSVSPAAAQLWSSVLVQADFLFVLYTEEALYLFQLGFELSVMCLFEADFAVFPFCLYLVFGVSFLFVYLCCWVKLKSESISFQWKTKGEWCSKHHRTGAKVLTNWTKSYNIRTIWYYPIHCTCASLCHFSSW